MHSLRKRSLEEQVQLFEEQEKQLIVTSPVDGQVTTWNARDLLLRRPVTKGQMLLTVVMPQGDWELELQMPENDMGYIAEAQAELGPELPVTYISMAKPGVKLPGTVKEVHQIAEVKGEEGNTVLIRVAINKDDVPVRRDGAEVTAQVYCGRASLGYVWFHDLVTFVQSKILFRLF